jgi:hypothetical protein
VMNFRAEFSALLCGLLYEFFAQIHQNKSTNLSINNRIMMKILSWNDFFVFLGIKIVTIRFSVGFGTYLAPHDANFKAKSRPKPRAAPVISMTLPK